MAIIPDAIDEKIIVGYNVCLQSGYIFLIGFLLNNFKLLNRYLFDHVEMSTSLSCRVVTGIEYILRV